jgi:DNA-binding XRE family transcriptional regulator
MDFTVVQRAGMTQLEFSTLAGVSRVTTNMWCRGKMSPHKYIRSRITALLHALESAVADAQLPLESGTPKAERVAQIKERVRTAAQRPATN